MPIQHGDVVAFDYRLTNAAGEELDASRGEPLHYLHGFHQIVPGLEAALGGREVGEALAVVVPAAEGYGDWESDRVIQVHRQQLPPSVELSIGQVFQARGPDGSVFVMRVTALEGEQVTLDGNHPLAGIDLHFAVTVRAVRAASPEELAHGHAHGPGGHHA